MFSLLKVNWELGSLIKIASFNAYWCCFHRCRTPTEETSHIPKESDIFIQMPGEESNSKSYEMRGSGIQKIFEWASFAFIKERINFHDKTNLGIRKIYVGNVVNYISVWLRAILT